MGKPSRSDELLSEEEELQVARKVQEYFQRTQPKRPTRPERSDPTAFDPDLPLPSAHAIPELIRFKELKSKSIPLPEGGGVVSGDDYEETEYYKDLSAVEGGDHHTTGSGYIRAEVASIDSLHLECKGAGFPGSTQFKCNPATNEWEPSSDLVLAATTKPSRSDP